MLSPFFAWFLSSAKMRSCLRIRLAPSISLVLAISTSSVTGLDLRSDRCIDGGVAGKTHAALRAAGFNRGIWRWRIQQRRWWRLAAYSAGASIKERSGFEVWCQIRGSGHAGGTRGGWRALKLAVKEGGQLRLG